MDHTALPLPRLSFQSRANNGLDYIKRSLTFLGDRRVIDEVISARKNGNTGLLLVNEEEVLGTESGRLIISAQPVTTKQLQGMKDQEFVDDPYEPWNVTRKVVRLNRPLFAQWKLGRPTDFAQKQAAPNSGP